MSIWKSIKGLFGQTIYYKDGKYAGESWDGFIPGSKTHYDADGRYVGYSDPGLLGTQVHHNEFGGRMGETWTDDFGVSRHYTDDRGYIGSSYDSLVSRTTYIDDVFDDSNADDSLGGDDW